MTEAKTREFDLDAVRTDGWFERIGEGIRALKDSMKEGAAEPAATATAEVKSTAPADVSNRPS